MLRMQAVNQFYGPKHILRDISMELPRGTCTYLLGRNGVGKVTVRRHHLFKRQIYC